MLSSSTAQLAVPFASFTSMKTCTCGFNQSTFDTVPLSVIGLAGSNFAAGT